MGLSATAEVSRENLYSKKEALTRALLTGGRPAALRQTAVVKSLPACLLLLQRASATCTTPYFPTRPQRALKVLFSARAISAPTSGSTNPRALRPYRVQPSFSVTPKPSQSGPRGMNLAGFMLFSIEESSSFRFRALKATQELSESIEVEQLAHHSLALRSA